MRREEQPFVPGERPLIKIEPAFATDFPQVRALLRLDPEPVLAGANPRALFLRGLTFWQHWLPSRVHVAPSIYLAKEDGIILGLIVLKPKGHSRLCWQIDHLIVHPHHRGRGIAQELLRYAFALFGSQGASHFVTEVANDNAAALSLYGSCGFRRCAQGSLYRSRLKDIAAGTLAMGHPPESVESVGGQSSEEQCTGDQSPEVEGASTCLSGPFRLAVPADKQALFILHQEALPPDIRLVASLSPEDFTVSGLKLAESEALRQRVMRRQGWYWVAEDTERRVLTAAVKVLPASAPDYNLEIAAHPGWTDILPDLIGFCLNELLRMDQSARVTARCFDYQTKAEAAMASHGLERQGSIFFLAREHWMRAKSRRKAERQLGLPSLSNPAVNFPLATERSQG